MLSHFPQINVKLVFKNETEEAKKAAERCLYNTIEQQTMFLVLMWMHAAFVDASTSATLGANYVFFRMLYSVFYSMYGQFTILGELSTQPNYICLVYYQLSLLFWAMDWGSFHDLLLSVPGSFIGLTAFFFVAAILNMMVLWNFPTGYICAKMNNAANPNPKARK